MLLTRAHFAKTTTSRHRNKLLSGYNMCNRPAELTFSERPEAPVVPPDSGMVRIWKVQPVVLSDPWSRIAVFPRSVIMTENLLVPGTAEKALKEPHL